jgi:pimeloyl-ACP methyl ester carboxylesterase
MTAAVASERPLRLLCLHGFVQNGNVFSERTGSLRKATKSVCEWAFVDAPHSAKGAFPESESSLSDADGGDPLGWWTSGENCTASDGTWVRPSVSRAAVGFDESLDLLRSVLHLQGPFDGVLGFSQGAAMAAQLLAAEPARLRFGILIAGFLPFDERLSANVQSAAPLPQNVMSVHGSADALVSRDRALALHGCFGGPGCVLYEHDRGHGVPSNAAFRTAFKEFIAAQKRADQHAALDPLPSAL